MAQIEVSELYPKCRKWNLLTSSDLHLSLDEIKMHLRSGWCVGIFVDGWGQPWGCFFDEYGELRARCPTAPKVVPLVVQVSRDGAVFTGEIE